MFSLRGFLVFVSLFPFFSCHFRGSVGVKNLCFLGGFPRFFFLSKIGRTPKASRDRTLLRRVLSKFVKGGAFL